MSGGYDPLNVSVKPCDPHSRPNLQRVRERSEHQERRHYLVPRREILN